MTNGTILLHSNRRRNFNEICQLTVSSSLHTVKAMTRQGGGRKVDRQEHNMELVYALRVRNERDEMTAGARRTPS